MCIRLGSRCAPPPPSGLSPLPGAVDQSELPLCDGCRLRSGICAPLQMASTTTTTTTQHIYICFTNTGPRWLSASRQNEISKNTLSSAHSRLIVLMWRLIEVYRLHIDSESIVSYLIVSYHIVWMAGRGLSYRGISGIPFIGKYRTVTYLAFYRIVSYRIVGFPAME